MIQDTKPARSTSPNSRKYKEVGDQSPQRNVREDLDDDDFHPRDTSVNPKTSKRPEQSLRNDREQPTKDVAAKQPAKKDIRGSEDDNSQLIKNVKITKGVINSHSRLCLSRLPIPRGAVNTQRVRGGGWQRSPTHQMEFRPVRKGGRDTRK